MDEQQQQDPSPPDDLESAIRESLQADAAPGIPEQIDFGLPTPSRQVEAPQEQPEPIESPQQDAPEDVAFVEEQEPLVLPHEQAHPFGEESTAVTESNFDFPEDAPPAAADDPIVFPQRDQQESEEPEIAAPQRTPAVDDVPQQPVAEQRSPSIDDEIPLPDVSPFAMQDSPMVSPLTDGGFRDAGGGQTVNVEMQMPDHRELMDGIREQIAPMLERMQRQLGHATDDALDVERQMMDRRNVY